MEKLRGYEIYWDGKCFRYCDNGQPTVGNRRDCGRCGLPETKDGHDGCIGELEGVMNACCGHGDRNEAYIQFNNGLCIRREGALKYMAESVKSFTGV